MNDDEWEEIGQLVGKPVSVIKGVWMKLDDWETVKAEVARLEVELVDTHKTLKNIRAQREYYAGLVEEARAFMPVLLENVRETDAMREPDLMTARNAARAWLEKPNAWARKDDE